MIFRGDTAQLAERFNGIEEVTGSNPVGSIFFLHIGARRQRYNFVMMNSRS
jgi:hypothetical protein